MIENPQLHPNFWLGSLQLLYWIVFRPLTLRRYTGLIDPDLREDFTLLRAVRRWKQNPLLRRFLLHYSFLITVVPAVYPGFRLFLALLSGRDTELWAGGVAFIASYLRLPLYPVQVLLQTAWWQSVRLAPARSQRTARGSAIFWDEWIVFRLPWLDHQLVAIAQANPVEGAAQIAYVRRSMRQRWAADRAVQQLAAEEVRAARTLAQVSGLLVTAHWLQAESEAYDALEPLLRSIRAGLERENLHFKRTQLEKTRKELQSAERLLYTLRKQAATYPIYRDALEQWSRLVDAEVQALDAQAQRLHTVPNPFAAGKIAAPDEGPPFKGRRDLFRLLEDQLAVTASHKPTLVPHGQRRIGKSSVLLQFPVRLDNVVPVYVDMQAPASTESNQAFLKAISRALVQDARQHRRLKLPELPEDALKENPFSHFAEWLDRVEDQLGDQRLLLNLDEFEKLQEGIEAGTLTKQPLDMLRHLIQHHSRLLLLLAGSRTFDELAPYWSDYLIDARLIHVGKLDEPTTRELITRPTPDFPADYFEPSAVDRIWALTTGQPYLVHLVCGEIINKLNLADRKQATVADVDQIIQDVLERGTSAYFGYLWNFSSPREQQILKAVASQTKARTADLLELGTEASLREALRMLKRRELLNLTHNEWTFDLELTRLWVAKQQIDTF